MKKATNKRFNINIETTIGKMLKRIKGDGTDNKLIIPEYQRDYVWNEKADIPGLLTSLYIGYPIGFITVWDNNEDDEYQLIDGLQRHYSIFKIYEKPYNYLHFDMFRSYLENNDIDFDEKIDKENFRHFRSMLNHKNNNYRRREKEEIIKWINTTTRLEGNEKFRKYYLDFIEEYSTWFENEFETIIVPHNILKKFKVDEVAAIFELINSKGKKLNKFEIASAQWSKYKITLDKEVSFISDFQDNRVKKYKSAFESPEELSEEFIGYDNKRIIPSNFIYSIFEESLKPFTQLWYSFYDNNESLQNKAVEAVTEIVKEALMNKYNLEEFDLSELGSILSKNIKSAEDVQSLSKIIKTAIKNTVSSLKIVQFAKANSTKKNLTFPSWLLTIFIILNIKGATPTQRKEHNKWFLNEVLFENDLDSGTGNKAKQIINERKYNESFETKNNITKEEFANKIEQLALKNYIDGDLEKIDNKTKLLLCLAQYNHYKPALFYQIDHLLPQAKMKGINNLNYNSLFNLQYLDNLINNEKDDDLDFSHIEFDVFKNSIVTGGYSEDYNENIKKMAVSVVDKKELDISNVRNILEIRKKIMIDSLKSLEWY